MATSQIRPGLRTSEKFKAKSMIKSPLNSSNAKTSNFNLRRG